jgi:EmrB/QacA subfamily drug resistance transporter
VINSKTAPCQEGTIRSVGVDPACAAGSRRWLLAATILGSAMDYIDGSVVNVALPAINADLRASGAAIQWLVNAYTLCLAAVLLIGGAAGDRFGRRRLFIAGIGVFAVASVACGLAMNVAELIAARAVQGLGAALMVPNSLAIIGASFAEAERGRAIGIWAGASAIATAIGPLLGGFIVDHASWRWIFLINPLVAVPTILLALSHIRESRDPSAVAALDWPGGLAVLAGLGGVVFGLIASSQAGWQDPLVIGSIAAGLVALIVFVVIEARSAAPMLPLGLFASATFSGVNIVPLLLYAALGGAFFFLPFDLIQVHGYSATAAGAAFLPFTLIMGGLSRWAGGLLDRFGARLPLVVGPTIAAAGFALLALLGTDGAYWDTFFLPIAILGLGMTVAVAPLTTTVINAVPRAHAGVASGVNNAAASVANLLAVALLGAVALGVFDRALDRRAAEGVPGGVSEALAALHGKFASEEALGSLHSADRQLADGIVRASLAESIRIVMGLAAALAVAGAACAAVTMPGRSRQRPRA